jgi:hypothetical protein
MTDMLHNKRRKSKGEKRADFKALHARNDASKTNRKEQEQKPGAACLTAAAHCSCC